MEWDPSEVLQVLTLFLVGPGSSTTADSPGPYLMLCVSPIQTPMKQWVLATCWALDSLGA